MFTVPEVKCGGCNKVVKHTDIKDDGSVECGQCEYKRTTQEIWDEINGKSKKKKVKK